MSHNDIEGKMFHVTCSRFFHVTILSVVTELGLNVWATDTEVKVVVVPAILGITSSVVVEQLWFIRTSLEVLTTGVVVTEVLFARFITDLMVTTVASLAVVRRHLLAGLHTGVWVSRGGGDAGIVVAVLTLLANPGVPWLYYSQVVATTDTALRPHLGQVSPVTLQSWTSPLYYLL